MELVCCICGTPIPELLFAAIILEEESRELDEPVSGLICMDCGIANQ